jgi:hypothetical protein
MFCFVDFRNRPQYKYTFHSREKAREYLRKIQNNPLGATIIHADGRREYFSSGVPTNLLKSGNGFRIKKGCHVKYKIRPLAVLDSIASNRKKEESSNISNWRSLKSSPLFMLGNLKFSACLLIISLTAFSFTYIFQKNFGQSAAAEELQASGGIVLGATDSQIDDAGAQLADNSNPLQLADENIVMNLIAKIDDEQHADFTNEILAYVKGKPMEDMAPYIAKQPRIVAAFIVGIAMKESKFGTYSPHDANGNDCHNYWGYRGPENTTASGYSCFATPEAAVTAVGGRIARLVDGGRTNPAEMVVWKCGASCSWDDPANVRSWIADVGINFYKLNNKS